MSVKTHWDRMTHICVGKLAIIDSDNGLSPGRRQSIIRTNVGILLIGTLGTNFSEIWSEIHTFSFKEMHLKMSGRWRPLYLCLNVLGVYTLYLEPFLMTEINWDHGIDKWSHLEFDLEVALGFWPVFQSNLRYPYFGGLNCKKVYAVITAWVPG